MRRAPQGLSERGVRSPGIEALAGNSLRHCAHREDCNLKDGDAHATFHPSDTGDCRIDVELIGGCILSQLVSVSAPQGSQCPWSTEIRSISSPL